MHKRRAKLRLFLSESKIHTHICLTTQPLNPTLNMYTVSPRLATSLAYSPALILVSCLQSVPVNNACGGSGCSCNER
jgi:hypothetical protein